jgi:hypothetical protein
MSDGDSVGQAMEIEEDLERPIAIRTAVATARNRIHRLVQIAFIAIAAGDFLVLKPAASAEPAAFRR